MSLIFWFSSVPSSLNKHTLATSTNGQSVAFIEHILKNKPFWNGEQQKGSVSGNSFPVSFPSCAIIINDAAGPFASFTCTKKERTKERKKERTNEIKNEREVIGRSVFIAGKKCERNGRVLPR